MERELTEAVGQAVERAFGRPTLSTEEAAELLGVDRHTLWRAARDGTAPVPHFRVGTRALRWPVAPILALLQLDQNGTSPEP